MKLSQCEDLDGLKDNASKLAKEINMKKINMKKIKSIVSPLEGLEYSNEHTSEYQSLQLQQMRLQVEQMQLDVQIRKLGVSEMSTKALCDKIEQARRNVEVLSKLVQKEGDEIQKTIYLNIAVLKEVVNIK